MNMIDFLKKNFTGEQIESFEKDYKEKYTRQAYDQFKNISLDNFKTYRWQLLADHFTGGDVVKIFSMYCQSKQSPTIHPVKVIHPKYKKV